MEYDVAIRGHDATAVRAESRDGVLGPVLLGHRSSDWLPRLDVDQPGHVIAADQDAGALTIDRCVDQPLINAILRDAVDPPVRAYGPRADRGETAATDLPELGGSVETGGHDQPAVGRERRIPDLAVVS